MTRLAEWRSPRERRLTKGLRRTVRGYLFLVPAIAFYFVLVLYPLGTNFQLSLTSWDGVSKVKPFVGLANYARILSDPLAIKSLVHNLIFLFAAGIVPVCFALVLAVLLWGGTRGVTFFRAIYFMPQVLSLVVVGLVWLWIYNPVFGAFNEFLKVIGLGSLARGWLGNPATALPAMVTVIFWQSFGFWTVIFLAGLQGVDLDVYDAAKVDGANAWQLFIHVTIPQLRNTITLCLALAFIGIFKMFDIVYATTKGGPFHTTEVIGTYIFKSAFQLSYMGYGAALSVMLTVVVVICTILFIRFREMGE